MNCTSTRTPSSSDKPGRDDLVAVRRTFFGDFLKALNFHGGHGTPSFDRAYAELLRAQANKIIEQEPVIVPECGTRNGTDPKFVSASGERP